MDGGKGAVECQRFAQFLQGDVGPLLDHPTQAIVLVRGKIGLATAVTMARPDTCQAYSVIACDGVTFAVWGRRKLWPLSVLIALRRR